MNPWQQFAVSLATQGAAVVLFFPILHWKSRLRPWAASLLGLITLLAPFAISPGHPTIRLIATLFASGILVKVYDLTRNAMAGNVPSLVTYFWFIENPFWHVLGRRPTEHYHDFSGNLRLAAIRFTVLALSSIAAYEVFTYDWRRQPFIFEHVTKVLVVYAVLTPVANGIAAYWRLLGQPAMDTMRHPLTAITPADFWRRWNRPTQMWFHEHCFLPAGGWRAPVRATLISFAVSGLAHELVFGIAIGRVPFVQMCFFMLQGVAVILTLRVRPRGWQMVAGFVLTLTFNLATSLLFFRSVGMATPFYVSR
jgi:hypothetical protein